MIKEIEAASVEIDLVISSIGLRADMTLLTRSNFVPHIAGILPCVYSSDSIQGCWY